jgi:diadenosine tetraphosphate (Ap4A) HIT family hydrolase
MVKHEDCVFCHPGERVLKENEFAQVILSNPRKVPGHFLVIPKRHIEKPWELTNEELVAVFELIFFVEKKIIGKLGDGADVKDHVHFHVYPRSLQDYLYKVAEVYETDLFADLDDYEREEVGKLLK